MTLSRHIQVTCDICEKSDEFLVPDTPMINSRLRCSTAGRFIGVSGVFAQGEPRRIGQLCRTCFEKQKPDTFRELSVCIVPK